MADDAALLALTTDGFRRLFRSLSRSLSRSGHMMHMMVHVMMHVMHVHPLRSAHPWDRDRGSWAGVSGAVPAGAPVTVFCA